MIKWIGQHIWDFVSRFRNDVYLENIADGTVANDKFLGLDSSNKVVKEAIAANTDTKIWQRIIPGYIADIDDTNYYTRNTTTFLNWSFSDTDPSSGIGHTEAAAPFFIANVGDGNITEINIQGTATGTDPIVFYFYKANPAAGVASVSLTEMFNTGSITPAAANRAYAYASTVSSSNTFTQDQRLYVYAKKASNSGSSNNYYTISVSGEYT